LIEKGGNFTVTDDFLVESSAMGVKSVLVGDPFDLWVGDSTWMDITSVSWRTVLFLGEFWPTWTWTYMY